MSKVGVVSLQNGRFAELTFPGIENPITLNRKDALELAAGIPIALAADPLNEKEDDES